MQINSRLLLNFEGSLHIKCERSEGKTNEEIVRFFNDIRGFIHGSSGIGDPQVKG